MADESNVDVVIDDAAKVAKEAVKADVKSFWKSKTFWANSLIIGAKYLGYLPDGVEVFAVAGLNIALRFLTSTAVGVKP